MSEIYTGRHDNNTGAKNNIIDIQAAPQKGVAEPKAKEQPLYLLVLKSTFDGRQDRQSVLALYEKEKEALRKRLQNGGHSEEDIAWRLMDPKMREDLERQRASEREREKLAEEQQQKEKLTAYYKAHGIPEFTKENWEKLTAGIKTRARTRREQEKFQAKSGDRIDPLTGERLEKWEIPLGANAQYQIMGKNRPRRFLPPNSADFEKFQILEQPGETETGEQEKYRTQRTIERLLRAGWVEVAPTRKDYADFVYDKWLDSLSPYELAKLWNDTQKNLRERKPAPESLLMEFVRMLVALLFGIDLDEIEDEQKNHGEPSKATYPRSIYKPEYEEGHDREVFDRL